MTQNDQTTTRAPQKKGKRAVARRRQTLLTVCAVALIAVLCAVYFISSLFSNDDIYDGITFMDKNLGGMSQTQA